MLKLNIKILLCISSFYVLYGNNFENIGLITKSIGNVKFKKNDARNSFKLESTQSIDNKDIIITNKDGFAKFVYFDDGSVIKVHKDSEIIIEGDVNKQNILKKIIINKGIIYLTVNKQINEGFTVITPHSTAIAKEAKFWVKCDNKKQDDFISILGTVNVKNNFSEEGITLNPKAIISSFPEGLIKEDLTQKAIINRLNNLEQNMGEPSLVEEINKNEEDYINHKKDNKFNVSEFNQKQINSKEIKIHLTNNDGVTKKIVIMLNKVE